MKKFLFIILILVFGPAAFAQNIGPQTQSFNLELSPKFPTALSEVSAKVTSFTFDIDRAQITWILDARIIAQGTGVKEVKFKTGAVGSANTLRVVISPQDGPSLEKTIEIRPGAIDILIESLSFVPVWYKGAGLPAPFGNVKVTALPNFVFEGARLDPKTLIYNWKINGAARVDISGRGRQSITIRPPSSAGGRTEVLVKISSPLGTFEQEANVFIESSRPEILFYEKRPLEGLITSSALNTKVIRPDSEIGVEAVPFFMNFSSLNDLNFSWQFNGAPAETLSGEKNVFTVKALPGTSGVQASVRLIINNLKMVLEEISASFDVYVQ